MPTIMAVVCLALLILVDPVRAQVTHELTVRHHPNIALSDDQVDSILAEASKILKKNSCDVTFKRKGPVRPFGSSSTPEAIGSEADRDAVHRERSDVKVVGALNFCRDEGPHAGCAWDPAGPDQPPQRRSMIVSPQSDARRAGLLWAHEFGHRTGLWHRSEVDALMTICELNLDAVIPQEKVNSYECNCFMGGPGSCSKPEPEAACPVILRRP